jgi:hypothetical protein
MTEQQTPEQPESTGGTQPTERSGGVDIHSDNVHVGGDVTGRDKVTTTWTVGVASAEFERLFVPLMQVLHNLPPEQRDEATQKTEALKSELSKGKDADDTVLAKLVDGIVKIIPNGVSAIVGMFASPILAGIAGPVTKFVLDRIQGK